MKEFFYIEKPNRIEKVKQIEENQSEWRKPIIVLESNQN